ncbi:MAG: ATP-binding protein, partial [Actinomycetota bacterium]|nr:ATP-binding protein [Actinomycetota bacterium]
GYVIATVGTAAVTGAFLPFRDDITPLSKGFGYLLVVVAAAAIGGLGPGVCASVVGFLTFNFFFLPPYGTFIIGRGEYVAVLFVFLVLSILISALLARWTERAEVAEAREDELRALQTLSAELVAVGPGPDSYRSVLARLMSVFGFSAGALFVQDPTSRELEERVAIGAAPGELSPRQEAGSVMSVSERLPLSVGGRVLGLFVLESPERPHSPAASRVLRAFSDQFALVLERDRLLRAATEAEVYRQADEVRRSLLAAVSHDLRSPLSAIKASVTDLLGSEAGRVAPAPVRDALTTIDEETDRLSALIADLLDMSRIEGGILRARIQGVDLSEALATSVDRVRKQLPALDISVAVAPDAEIVRADPIFLDRVGTNILDNAAKAAREAGDHRVDVEVTREGDRVTVRVIDHGGGIPDAASEQLFYPFYRITERHPRLGTGLGLAIAKGFLDLMAGDIWIEETPGGGATFAFSLPAGGAA